MSLFDEFVKAPIRDGQQNPSSGIPISLEKLSKVINYLNKSQIVTISGRPTSGKSSLMDQIYFVEAFRWWRNQEEDSRPPMKVMYFNMKSSPQYKLQKWLCLYMKLQFDTIIDIPTITNGIGKLYDLNDEVKDDIVEATDFFEDLESVLELFNRRMTPSAIYNKIRGYMDTIGSVDDEGNYELNEEHKGQLTHIYIDNTSKLVTETDGHRMMDLNALENKLSSYLEELKTKYGVTIVLVKPSKASNSRMVRDSEPSYKDLGSFYDVSDVGLVTYNPFDETNSRYLGYPVEDLVINGKNRFRTITAVRNKVGIENVTVGTIFIGECGYFRESPKPNETQQFEDFKDILSELP